MNFLSSWPWHKRTLALALPMILTNLTVPLTGMVDTAVMGHLEDASFLAASAIGATLFTLLLWLMGFLRMSTTGLTAQAQGAEQNHELIAVLYRAGLLALAIGVIGIALQKPIWLVTSYLMTAEQSVLELANTYFSIRIWALPAVLLRFVLIGWLLGVQRARGPLLILIVTNLINIVLDIYWVVYCGWNIEGVAYASLVADWVGLAVGFWFVVKVFAILELPKLSQTKWFNPDKIKRLFHLNRDIFIRTLALEAVFYSHTVISSSFDTLVLAANAILMNFVLLLSYGLDGFAHAVEALAGHAFGAKQKDNFKQAITTAAVWSLITALGFCLVYSLFSNELIGLMSDQWAIQMTAANYSVYLVVLPLIAVWSYWLDGIFIGITDSRSMRNSMVVSVLLGFFPLALLVLIWGNHGLWIAFLGFMIIRASLLALPLKKLIDRPW